jgi:membrane protein implicated in regulation of membrane protease activity
MTWWGWVLSGLFLLAVEMLAAGSFFIFFFGVGAVLVGLLAAVGAAGPTWLQWLLFPLFSLATLALFRRRLLATTSLPGGRADRDDFIGLPALALEDLPPGGSGRVEMRGTSWGARNLGSRLISRGDPCLVMDVQGLTLGVQRED